MAQLGLVMYEDLPEALKGAKEYLVKAEQFKKLDPVVSVYCKVYALDLVTKTLDRTDKSAVSFLMKLMDQVEKEKKALGNVEDAQQQVELMALKVFDKGDNQYRAGKADLNTVKSLRAASQLFEVCTQFCPNGELPFDLNEKYMYAKVKAGEIFMAIKEGRTPLPPSEDEIEMPMPPPDCPPPDAGAPSAPPDARLAPPSHPRPPGLQPPPAVRPSEQAMTPARAGGPPPPKVVHQAKPAEAYTAMGLAEKHTKYALSALQFEDIPEAIKNLKEALRIIDPSSQ